MKEMTNFNEFKEMNQKGVREVIKVFKFVLIV